MDLYSRLMGIDEVIEYLNEKTNRDFNKDKIIKFIKEKKIPIVFEYEGWGTWEFRAESGWQSLNMKVKGYFKFRNRNDAVNIFKGFLEEINLHEAIIYQLDSSNIRGNVPNGIKPKKGDDILFETGGVSPIFSHQNTRNFIIIDNGKVGVLKSDLREYLNKMQINHIDNKTNIETLESKIEKLETENACLIQKHTKALTAADVKVKRLEQDIGILNAQLKEQIDHQPKDKELTYKSQMGVARMLYTIFTENKYNLSAPRGKTNTLIEKASELHGTPVTKNFIAKWIDLANQAKSDSTK
ncbi:hypothetical protein [Psychrobacter urativorans]|uniref:Uncharacterized protein n=1 Tax=Psychrobacter urativorans TaxID=45610 RepID=A0A0M5MQ21_9GAMM|nr:hypothetical protein [Psychrobacter urativorans]ALF60125.1 hypothetical protein AOC03_08805 [Psychrobacter urativorans]